MSSPWETVNTSHAVVRFSSDSADHLFTVWSLAVSIRGSNHDSLRTAKLSPSRSIGGHSVSRGTRVLVNMWSIHHDPAQWDKPDLFNPDRFLDDQGQRVTPSFFLPFGAGPRVCVGESLARLELFLFLSSLLQRMSFRQPDGAPPPNLQGRLGVVLQPLPYKLVVTPRAGWAGGAK
ncbi:steroid 17-alpha-hydroxylase/17,20 lyase-like [Cottoperca gobio]|uniref:Steroid 17-alpha-hydroxylase/17,20 lyase-like n=1 Tax=Cottoperca gobio TaxID=56716 RepID=A0A6J2PC96_COTGO|nr:steroid 17-alpha-hydroxylase/17,20 lyase-like [Cottoperca gobio]